MNFKNTITLLLFTFFCITAWADDTGNTSRVSELKELLDQISTGEGNDLLIEAYRDSQQQTGDNDWTFWTGYYNSHLDDDRNGNSKQADGDTYTFGLDYRYSLNLLMGAAFIVQDTNVSSEPSPAPLFGHSRIENDGEGFSLYGMYILGIGLGIDANFSYLATEITTTDFSALAPPSTKSTNGDNYAFSTGANLIFPFSSRLWSSGRLSYTHAWGDQESFFDAFGRFQDEQDYETGTIGLTANLNYRFNQYFTPYAGFNLGYDVISDIANPALVLNPGGTVATAVPFQDERDNFSYGFQAGMKFFFNPSVSMSAGYKEQNWGSNLESSYYSVNLLISF